MGRRSRHSAKTGGAPKALESSRSNRDDSGDDDPMYNEVERYHNRKEEENYLKLDVDDEGGDSSSEDDGITKHQEGVFDLGIGGSSEEDDGDSEEEEEDQTVAQRAKKPHAASSESDRDVSDSDDDDAYGDKSNKLLNWGDKKHSYYHGDTADLEIGQDVEDAYLEEEAAREVEKAQLDDMDDEDFMLGTNENGSEVEEPKARKKKSTDEGNMEIIKSSRSPKQLSQLSEKEKMKLLKTNHPELLPLVQHFSDSVLELSETTLVAAGALLKNGVNKCAKEMEAVGATPAGLQYLITKSMLQASKALNLSLYLLLKSDQASSKKDDTDLPLVMEADASDDIRNHPVMRRLNQLSVLTDKLQEGVEEKTPGLKDQINSLVKAAALMAGEDLSSSDDSYIGDDDDGDQSSAAADDNQIDADDDPNQLASDDEANDHGEQSSSESDEEHETQEAIQRHIITEAKFALRNQDIDHDMKKLTNNRKRRLAPTSSDFGDENDEITDKTLTASRKLASTMNSIVQKSASSNEKRNKKSARDDDEEDEYDKLQRGLAMMEEELGKGSDDEDDDEDDEGLRDSDEDDFYQAIKSKSKAKKETKKQIYAVAPKYPRLDVEVDGERAIGRVILKNRGLVPHKPKINRNPRVKKREDYRKALIRRKGAVREIRTDEGHVYGGEATGIKSGISRSRKLGSRR